MSDSSESSFDRREFLTGSAVRRQLEQVGDVVFDGTPEQASCREIPCGGDTVRLATRAMACDFAVMMNPDSGAQISPASEALEMIHVTEQQLTVYRAESELSRLNREASRQPVTVTATLFDLLLRSQELALSTGGAFDPTSGPLIALWRDCRNRGRVPTDVEVEECLCRIGMQHVELDETDGSVRYRRARVELNFGGIGKGDALDRAAAVLPANGIENFLFHGGYSSLLARGNHADCNGWPVGIRNPLFPQETFATLLLCDRAMSSSGSGVQHFRLGGKRYGHILDPRSGWPAEGMLSVTVLAKTAAEADALSTAFFVMGVEKALESCNNREGVGTVLIPPPRLGRKLEPVVCNIPDDILFFHENTSRIEKR